MTGRYAIIRRNVYKTELEKHRQMMPPGLNGKRPEEVLKVWSEEYQKSLLQPSLAITYEHQKTMRYWKKYLEQTISAGMSYGIGPSPNMVAMTKALDHMFNKTYDLLEDEWDFKIWRILKTPAIKWNPFFRFPTTEELSEHWCEKYYCLDRATLRQR